jgi:hypothetical protein
MQITRTSKPGDAARIRVHVSEIRGHKNQALMLALAGGG